MRLPLLLWAVLMKRRRRVPVTRLTRVSNANFVVFDGFFLFFIFFILTPDTTATDDDGRWTSSIIYYFNIKRAIKMYRNYIITSHRRRPDRYVLRKKHVVWSRGNKRNAQSVYTTCLLDVSKCSSLRT